MPDPRFVDLDGAKVEQLLERARAALPAEDYAWLAGLIATLSQLMRIVRQRGTTIARLRRLLGWTSSEKTADVLSKHPAGDPTPADQGGQATGDGQSGAEPRGARKAKGASARAPRGHGRIPASAYTAARQVDVAHESLDPGHACPACTRGKLHRLAEPARLVRIVGQPPLVATCWDCERLRCSTCGQVFTAQAPAEAQGPKYADSAASMMALLRYGAGMPLHRLAQLERDLETPLPASTQWDVVLERVAGLDPVYRELVRCAAAGTVVHNDDTYMRILEFMGKRRAQLLARRELPDPERTGLFTTAVVSRTEAGPIALFFTGRQHAGENLAALLDERAAGLPPPIQMCDALTRNLPKGHPVIEANCMSHGRRHVVDEVENFPEECRHVLEALATVFENEGACKRQGLSDEDRLRFHQRESGPVLAMLEHWMKDQLAEKHIEPNSGLGEAFRYLLSRWDKLTLFLRVAGAPLENNICERALKKAIAHRKNSLFYRTQRGARVGDVYMTLIHTAELHGANPFDYLTSLQHHAKAVAESPGDWLPWTYQAALQALSSARSQAA